MGQMESPLIDIIVTVWNRPVETRNCLVNLIDHSPRARLILVDNSSDRETERLLEEFADILDQRALLLRNQRNQGYVPAINRGLARSQAPFLAVVRNTSIVSAGWLEPLLDFAGERGDAGILVPRLVSGPPGKDGGRQQAPTVPVEIDHGSFSAMVIKKELYDLVPGFAEDMDGATWCLRDYSRRAFRHGFLTFRVEAGKVFFAEEVPLGSAARRAQALEQSSTQYRERWGEEKSYCVHFPKETDISMLKARLAPMLLGARQGDTFTLLTYPKLYKELVAAGCHHLHDHIRFVRLPPLFEARAINEALVGGDGTTLPVRAVAGVCGTPFPGNRESIAFDELERMIALTRSEKYGE